MTLNINPFLIIIPYLFVAALYLRSNKVTLVPRIILTSLLLILLGLSLFVVLPETGWGWPQDFNRLAKPLLDLIAGVLILISEVVFRGIDLARSHPVASVMVLGGGAGLLTLGAIFFDNNNSWRKKGQRYCLILLGFMITATCFYLLYPLLTPKIPNIYGISSIIAAGLEGIIYWGKSFSEATREHIIPGRRLLPLLTLALAGVMVIKKNRAWGPILMLMSLSLALLAQSYIFSENFAKSIYLYLGAGLVLVAARLNLKSDSEQPQNPSFLSPILVTLILVISIVLGFYRLYSYPVRYHQDEAMHSNLLLEEAMKFNPPPSSWPATLEKARENPITYFIHEFSPPGARPNPRCPLTTHSLYLCLKLFPVNFITFRTSSVLLGMLSVLLFYLSIRVLAGTPTALMAAGLLTASSWQLALIRLHLPYAATGCYLLICIYLFFKALQKGNLSLYFLLGIALAFSSPFYPTLKMVYLLLPAFIAHQIIFVRGFLRRHLPGIILLFVTVMGLLNARKIAPINQFVQYQGQGAETVFAHSQYLRPTETLLAAAKDSWVATENLLARIFHPALFEVRRRPFLERELHFNALIVPFSVMGLLWGLLHFSKKRYAFPVIWLLCSLAPDIITGNGSTDRRATLAIPPLLALAAIFLHSSWRIIAKRVWSKKNSYRICSGVASLIFISLALPSGIANYFHSYRLQENLNSVLIEYRQMKDLDRFLGKVLIRQPLVYFLNENSRYYLGQAFSHNYVSMRMFYKDKGLLRKRISQVNSRESINREYLLSGKEAKDFVIFGGKKNLEFLTTLKACYPGSKLYFYQTSTSSDPGIMALTITSPENTR